MKTDKSFLEKKIQHSIAVKNLVMAEHLDVILAAGHKIVECLQNGGKIMFCGNGGSAADSQHLAAELICKLRNARQPLPGIALTTDSSILTSVGNDYSFDDIFARQVTALGQRGDVLIGISTSGNSANVLEAVKAAKAKGVFSIGLLGNQGGTISKEVELAVIVPDSDTQRIQESHLMIGHLWMETMEYELFG